MYIYIYIYINIYKYIFIYIYIYLAIYVPQYCVAPEVAKFGLLRSYGPNRYYKRVDPLYQQEYGKRRKACYAGDPCSS